MFISLAMLFASCNGKKVTGDIVKIDGTKAIVVSTDDNGQPTMLLSVQEAANLDDDSAVRWVATIDGEGWHLPDKSEMQLIKKYKAMINISLRKNGLPTILANDALYWTSTPCSESHTYACGPQGVKCYFSTNASPYYRARAVKTVQTKQ